MITLLNICPTGNATRQPVDGSATVHLCRTECATGATGCAGDKGMKFGLLNLISFDTIQLLSKRPNPRLRKW
jgi:hypothetical protein